MGLGSVRTILGEVLLLGCAGRLLHFCAAEPNSAFDRVEVHFLCSEFQFFNFNFTVLPYQVRLCIRSSIDAVLS